MKNILLNKIFKQNNALNDDFDYTTCYSCKKTDFFQYTPSGGDYVTCPICGTEDMKSECEQNKKVYKKYFSSGKWLFCNFCKIIFDLGCRHACNGCTSDCFNGHLVFKWKNKVTNEIFNGMPQFDSADEWIENNYEILEWCCPNNGLHCNKGSYSKEKYPQYYNTCYLVRE